jgi:site-specific recombinase XerD
MPDNRISLPENSSLLTENQLLQEELLVWLMNYNSRRTRRAYLYALEQLKTFIYERADMSLLDVEQKHIIAWKEWLVGDELSQSTINQKLSAVSSFYKKLIARGLMVDNPADGVKRYNVNPYGKATFLTLSQQRHLLEQIDRETEQGRRDYAMLLLFLTTGVRVSVVTSAYVGDIEWTGSEIVLNYTNKGSAAEQARITAIWPALEDYLVQRDARLDEPLFIATELGRQRTEHLPDEQGYYLRPLHANTVRGIVRTYAKRAGLENITPHSLRHSAAMTASQKGTVMEVSKLLRHKSLRITTVYLDHVTSQQADEITKDLARDLMDDAE